MGDYTLPDMPYDYAALEPAITGEMAEQASHQPVSQRQQHLKLVAATAPIMQQNPSSQYATVFSSGTGARARRLLRSARRGGKTQAG
ncbi:hypothetical protein [Nonomuraea cavernae]|uniref:Uncharacterized protein n=1 Tax=Nonomuraea cavernae TaxID=2045107 RepID=A0A918DPQ8_9ACTN|nr:hypothetical protein [Nonomuraea cavernae]MCA2187203.1 hypothetical protein [Nonomuraea cavernae]GGO78945.1 hypothetical protein GCM10012289_62100 [Nonomuraea cavernae]